MKQRKAKRKLEEVANKLSEWKEEEDIDEGSSDDEMESHKEAVLKKGMIPMLPISRVLCRKGSAYAIIADMGAGIEGFLPVSELTESPEMKDILSSKLACIKPPSAPAPGQNDRRPKILKVIATGDGQGSSQVVLSGRCERICTAMSEKWDGISDTAKAMLKRLYDRDRIGQLTTFAGLSTGTLLEGMIQHRTSTGLVVSLSNPWNVKQRNLIGVAVGLNAELPDTTDGPPSSPSASNPGTPGMAPGTPGSAPGTPFSIATDYNVKKLRPECIRCRVLDYDPASGFVDVACCNLVSKSVAATDKKLAISHYKSLKKKLGKPVPVQVILRKADYAIVLSKPFAGVLGYLALQDDPNSKRIKTGDKITAIVEYVRIKPQAPPIRSKAQRWELKGRTMLDDDEEKKDEKPKKKEMPRAPPDAWLCPEPFMVLTLCEDEKPVVQEVAKPAEVVKAKEVKVKAAPVVKKPAGIEVGFSFRDEEEEVVEVEAAKKKKRKKNDEDNELMIDEIERARLADDTPKSKEDFERLVMASPHSSYVWCQYMAYHVALKEYEQARLIAERALKTINYRETEELFNVWVAYLNLENGYGTNESLHAVFMRLVQRSDEPQKAYNALVDIGKAANHHVLVDRTYQTMLKKFGQGNVKPWVEYATYLMSRGQQDDITKLQKRFLNNQAMGSKAQVEFLLKVGCMQYRQGSIDKGRTIFEGLLVKYPKRTDIWSVYLDMEAVVLPKLDDMTRIRDVFDRVTSMPLSSKKMQFFMTRYLTFEKQHGAAERVEYVKKRAIDFVNARMGEAEDE